MSAIAFSDPPARGHRAGARRVLSREQYVKVRDSGQWAEWPRTYGSASVGTPVRSSLSLWANELGDDMAGWEWTARTIDGRAHVWFRWTGNDQ